MTNTRSVSGDSSESKEELLKLLHESKLELSQYKLSMQKILHELKIENEIRVKTENQLKESEKLFRTLANNGQALIWTSGQDKKCNYFNQPWLNFTGRSLEQELGDGWAEGVHPDDLHHCITTYVTAFDRREKFSMVYRVRNADGEYRWILDDGSPRYDSDGSFLGYIGHCLDITPQKQVEAALLKSQNRLLEATKSSGIWVWEVDESGLYTYFSNSDETLLGYNPEEVIGKKYFYDFFDTAVREELKEAAFAIFSRRGTFENFENANINKNGEVVILETSGSPMLDQKGKLIGYIGTDKNVSLQKNLIEQLQKNEEKYRSIFENIQDVYYEVSTDGIISEISPSINLISKGQYFREELIGTSIFSFYANSEDRNSFLENIIKNGRVNDIEVSLKNRDGSIIPCIISAKISFDETGSPVKIIGSLHDITNRKKAEEQLNKSQKLNAEILESITDGFVAFDGEMNYTYINKRGAELLGRKAEELIGKNYWKEFPEAVGTPFANYYMHALNSKSTIVFENCYEPWDRWFENRIYPTQDGIAIYYNETTERKRTERSLQESNDLNKTLLNTIPFGMDIVDQDGNIMFMSENFETLNAKDCIGKKCWSIYVDDKQQCSNCPLRSGIHIGKTELFETSGVFGGRSFQISHTGMMFQGKKAILEIFQDISELVENREKLKNAKNKAEESSRLKSALLTNMSHEIRTPMNAIMGFAYLLSNAEKEEVNSYAEIIQKSSNYLLKLIDDVILVSRLQSEKMPVNNNVCTPSELVSYIFQTFQHSDLNNGLEIKVHYQSQYANLTILSDEEKIRQILLNLTANAIKYTFEGSVEVGFEVLNDRIEFYVQDTGIGIPEQEQKKIFESFYRGKDAVNRAIRGNGLGLNIASELVGLIDGTLSVKSSLNKGSKFYFSIPIIEPAPTNSPARTSPLKQKHTNELVILIAEDEPTNFTILEIMLKNKVKKIDHALNGAIAVEMATKNNYDIVLMDIKMPVMGGLEATKILKQQFPELIIVAQTAFTLPEDVELTILAGCDDILPKPIRKEQLMEIIEKYCS